MAVLDIVGEDVGNILASEPVRFVLATFSYHGASHDPSEGLQVTLEAVEGLNR